MKATLHYQYCPFLSVRVIKKGNITCYEKSVALLIIHLHVSLKEIKIRENKTKYERFLVASICVGACLT